MWFRVVGFGLNFKKNILRNLRLRPSWDPWEEKLWCFCWHLVYRRAYVWVADGEGAFWGGEEEWDHVENSECKNMIMIGGQEGDWLSCERAAGGEGIYRGFGAERSGSSSSQSGSAEVQILRELPAQGQVEETNSMILFLIVYSILCLRVEWVDRMGAV